MVELAARALVFVELACVARGSGGRHSVLVGEFLEFGQGLDLEFDEVVQLFVILGAALTSSAVIARMRLVVSWVKGVTMST